MVAEAAAMVPARIHGEPRIHELFQYPISDRLSHNKVKRYVLKRHLKSGIGKLVTIHNMSHYLISAL